MDITYECMNPREDEVSQRRRFTTLGILSRYWVLSDWGPPVPDTDYDDDSNDEVESERRRCTLTGEIWEESRVRIREWIARERAEGKNP
jgi:hypothetical protein